LRSGQVANTVMVWEGVPYPSGDYVVLYDGEGTNAFGGNDLVITVVPEPSACVLLSVAGVGMLARRRRLK